MVASWLMTPGTTSSLATPAKMVRSRRWLTLKLTREGYSVWCDREWKFQLEVLAPNRLAFLKQQATDYAAESQTGKRYPPINADDLVSILFLSLSKSGDLSFHIDVVNRYRWICVYKPGKA
jgi:hypothetical protein